MCAELARETNRYGAFVSPGVVGIVRVPGRRSKESSPIVLVAVHYLDLALNADGRLSPVNLSAQEFLCHVKMRSSRPGAFERRGI